MRLTIIGSTGRTGRLVLAEALRRGHQVTAFTRRPAEVQDTPGITAVVPGDGRDRRAVRAAVGGADAVVAIVAAQSRKGPHHTAEVARVVTDEMLELAVPRLAITSAYPLVADRPRLPVAILRRVLAAAYADLRKMEEIVAGTDLEWTIVRLNRLTDEPANGRITTSDALLGKPTSVTRADVAATMLNIVDDRATARKAVNVAGS